MLHVCSCAVFWKRHDEPFHTLLRLPKSANARNRGTYAGRCRGRYRDFAADSGLLRLDCKGCRDRLAAKRGRIGRCERAIWAWRDGIGGGSAGESEVVMRAWSLPAESRQEERVSGRASIADDGIMT